MMDAYVRRDIRETGRILDQETRGVCAVSNKARAGWFIVQPGVFGAA